MEPFQFPFISNVYNEQFTLQAATLKHIPGAKMVKYLESYSMETYSEKTF